MTGIRPLLLGIQPKIEISNLGNVILPGTQNQIPYALVWDKMFNVYSGLNSAFWTIVMSNKDYGSGLKATPQNETTVKSESLVVNLKELLLTENRTECHFRMRPSLVVNCATFGLCWFPQQFLLENILSTQWEKYAPTNSIKCVSWGRWLLYDVVCSDANVQWSTSRRFVHCLLQVNTAVQHKYAWHFQG